MPRRTFTFDGKRYDITAKTDKELTEKIALKKDSLKKGRILTDSAMTVQHWSEQWLKVYVDGKVSEGWVESQKSILKNHIIPHLGRMKIRTVKSIHIQNLLNELNGASQSQISKVLIVLNGVFNTAKYNQLILSNPVEGVKRPIPAKKIPRRSITPTERKYILAVANRHHGGLFIKIMLYCGLRPGEVAALQWRHINLKKRTILVQQAVKRDGTIGEPKSTAGIRSVPIPALLLPDLSASSGAFSYVCLNMHENRYTKTAIRKMWENFVRELNIEMGCQVFRNKLLPPYRVANDLTLYCLRHTYCTDLQAAGIPINVAKELMGHSDIRTTSSIYTHQSEESFWDAAGALERLYNRRCGDECGMNTSTH